MQQNDFTEKEQVKSSKSPKAEKVYPESTPSKNSASNQPSSSQDPEEDQLTQVEPVCEEYPHNHLQAEIFPGNQPRNPANDLPEKGAPVNPVVSIVVQPRPQRRQPRRKSIPVRCLGCFMVMILVGGVFGFLIYILAFFYEKREVTLDLISGALDNLVSNLEADPIVELALINKGSSCLAGLNKLNIGKWAGTTSGCNCGSLSRGYCPDDNDSYYYYSTRILDSCSDIDPIDGMDLTSWRGSEWCARRAVSGTEFLKQSICPSGFQECAPGICILNSLSCPITSVTFSETDPTGNSDQLANPIRRRYLVLERTVGERPLIKLEMSLNDIPCFSLNKFPTGDTEAYVLSRERAEGCSKFGLDSEFSFAIDSQTQHEVLEENDAPLEVWDLPSYTPILKKTKVMLTGRYRIDVENKEECVNIETETILNAREAGHKVNSVVSAISITGVVLHSLLVIAIVSSFCYNVCNTSMKKTLSGKKARLYLGFSLVFGGLQLIIYIVMAALVRSRHAAMEKAEDYFGLLKENACFQVGQPPEVLEDFSDVQQVASRLSIDSLVLLLVTISLFVSSLFFCVVKKKC